VALDKTAKAENVVNQHHKGVDAATEEVNKAKLATAQQFGKAAVAAHVQAIELVKVEDVAKQYHNHVGAAEKEHNTEQTATDQ